MPPGSTWPGSPTPGQLPGRPISIFVRKHDAAGNELWTRQFVTTAVQPHATLSADATGVYVAGGTSAALPGQNLAGGTDVFVRKYDAAGSELWTRQFGTPDFDNARAVAADGTSVYVVGFAGGALPGQNRAGSGGAFVRKYNAAGGEI